MGACARWGAKGGRCLWANLLLYRPLLRPEAPELASPLTVVFPAIPRRKQDKQDIQINYTKERWPLSWVPDVSSSLFGWDSALVALATEDPQFSDSAQSCPTLLRAHGLQHSGLPRPSPIPRAYSNSCPLSRWCQPTISSSVILFSSCLQSFPASGSFQMSQFFTSGGQNIGVSTSASVLPVNIQDWFPLGWIGLISLQSKGLSRVFSNTTVQSISCSVLSFVYGPTLTSIHDYWKNQSFDRTDLCLQSDVSAF